MLSAEVAVKKLARAEENLFCPNCGSYSKFGFSTVCIKYYTFVCNSCKTAHQAVSHRCKSLTMSSWDQGEVLKLKRHGNEVARNTWLANAPPVGQGGRPKEGDDVNVFKRFIVTVYENKKYYSADGEVSSPVKSSIEAPPPQPTATFDAPTQPVKSRKPKQKAKPKAPAPAPAVDLLDFGAFDSAPTPGPSTQPANQSSVSTGNASNDFADFGAFESAAPSTSNQSSISVSSPTFDAFGDFSQAPAPAPVATNTFDPFDNTSADTSATATTQSNDLLSMTQPSTSTTASTTTKKPVMGNNQGTSSMISSMGQAPMMNNMGMNNMNNANMNMMNNTNMNMMNNMNMANFGGNNNMMMPNQGMMNSQQQMMMMQQQMNNMAIHQSQQNQMQNNFNMMNNGMMMGNMTGGNSMQGNRTMVSNTQPTNSVKKDANDPFAGLGF
ncbi:hypothetical protein CTEN210_15469 [Chaetoceros tenuissimus]|uniref:Arf-GAP domain-containing protein n=1 Tax=Chaetoceros tenuissimus TaxID=426638 RepID=A0AAD3D778_9STRA|nr:hypothetical protein CTEN210_15469 [Chaetoceros tenuissimus]